MNITRNIPLDQLGEALTRLPTTISVSVDETLHLPRLLTYAKALCPVATGALRDTIKITRPTNTTAQLTAGTPTVTYAAHVHDGTSRMPPRPFLLQALQAERDQIPHEITGRLIQRL